MAGQDSIAGGIAKSQYKQSTVEQDLRRLYRAEAVVELVRHYHESTCLHEALQNRHDGPLRERRSLPGDAFWPGEVSAKVITEALFSAFMDIRDVRISLNSSLHPHE